MTSLLNMPKDVMDVIVKDIGCKSIFTLRKVCRGLRDYIDEAKPDIKLSGIELQFNSKKLTFYYKIGKNVDSIKYEKHGESCSIKKEEIGINILEYQDFITLFFKNLKWILEFQKSNFEEIRLYLRDGEENNPEFRRSLESLNHTLMSRITPLRVEKVYIRTKTQSEIMSILPYLDAKSLKKFHVFWPGFDHELVRTMICRSPQVRLEMNEMCKLEHWNTIEEMKFLNLKTTESLMNFVHFPKFEVQLDNISVEELILLKKTFQKSTKMEQFQFKCGGFVTSKLVTTFGEPCDQTKKWFFRISNNNNRILQLTNDWRTYEFQYIEPSKVPLGAVIRD